MEKVEEQYEKIIDTFPNAILMNNFIFHIRIHAINESYIDIDYKNYPKKPKVKLINPDGQTYKKLDVMISSLKNWKKSRATSIVELINEILKFINGMLYNSINIKKEILEGILGLCKHQHPREILGLLRMENAVVSEFILPPGALTSENSGVFFPNRMPLDNSIEGTVHSHPTGNVNPSPTDLNGIFKKLRFHFIIGYPYSDLSCVKCYDRIGDELDFKIID